jgi:hypothetical protein
MRLATLKSSRSWGNSVIINEYNHPVIQYGHLINKCKHFLRKLNYLLNER